jgi:hypothetical protein
LAGDRGYVLMSMNAKQKACEQHIDDAVADLVQLMDEYDTLSPAAGEWIRERVGYQIEAVASAVDHEVSNRARIMNFDGEPLRQQVSAWRSRLREKVARAVLFEVGEAALRRQKKTSSPPRPRRKTQRKSLDGPKVGTISRADERILAELRKRVPIAAASFEQALHDLSDSRRLSWKGPANDLREALRETLYALAPTDEVMAEPGFKLESSPRPVNTGPTMRQRARYILRRRGVSEKTAKTVVESTRIIDEQYAALVRSIYDRGSMPAHSEASLADVEELYALVHAALSALLRNK